MRTLNLDEAAEFLKLCRDEIRRRARLGLLPGAKAGRRWIFIESDLADYLRSLYIAPTLAPVTYSPQRENQSWLSTNDPTHGGLTSPLRAANALERLLRPVTAPRRRNSTTR